MSDDRIAAARRFFAEELRHTARVRSTAVVEAFASVPRERFAGPGPWRILSPMRMLEYWTTEDADPAHLYHDVLVAIDESRALNNGQPSLWAFHFDELDLKRGAHVVHVGAGAGYYSAVLAEIVGAGGRVDAVEIDPDLAAKAGANLAAAGYPQATVVAADGFLFRPEHLADAVIVNAGVSHLSLAWLDSLAPEGGQLLVPLTAPNRFGAFVLITRQNSQAQRYAARYVGPVGIFPCVGGRDGEAETKLVAALQRAPFTAIRSLRRAREEPDDTCWLAGEGWWLSTAPS